MAGSPQHATLVADTVSTFTFDEDFDNVEVLSVDGAALAYFTTDGTTPEVAATGTHILPAAIGGLVVQPPTGGNTVVKVISAGTPMISVRGF
jgi:hypothetical protein